MRSGLSTRRGTTRHRTIAATSQATVRHSAAPREPRGSKVDQGPATGLPCQAGSPLLGISNPTALPCDHISGSDALKK